MTPRGPGSEKGRRLSSIKLKDFPENQGLADEFFDREFDEEETEETVVMTRDEIPEDEDGSSGLTVRSLSRMFDEDDISAGNTTVISREMLDEAGNLKEAVPSGEPEEAEKAEIVPKAPEKKKIKAPSGDQISRDPKPVEAPKEKKPPKMPKVKDFGKKKHSAAYRIIKFCIFLLIWIAVAFACYQGYKFGYRVLNDQPMDPADASKIQITVTGDETNDEMGRLLLDNRLIDDVGIFKWRCLLYDAEYYPGTFKLSRSYNTEKILNILAGYKYSEETMEEETAAETVSETAAETEADEAAEPVADDGEEDDGEEDNGEEDNN